MTLLADRDIREVMEDGRLVVDPWHPALLQPASIDVRLSPWVRRLTAGREYLDPSKDQEHLWSLDHHTGAIVVGPGECVLASTLESVGLPDFLAARVEGKSSLGRHFLAVHITAGYVDPGFSGHITLEVVNHASRPIRLWSGMRIAQLAFEVLSQPAARPYGSAGLGSHYQRQEPWPEPSRAHRGWTDDPARLSWEHS